MSSGQGLGYTAIIEEKLGHFIFVFGYLSLLLSVYALHNSIVLADWHLLGHLWPAMLKALIFTKFLLIGEHLKLGDRFDDRPLIWPILIKAALFSALLIGFDLLEGVIVGAIWPDRNADESPDLTSLRTSLSFALMTFVALIPFFGIRELSKVIGEAQMQKLFFRSRTTFKLVPEA
jgi:hypothetical protein